MYVSVRKRLLFIRVTSSVSRIAPSAVSNEATSVRVDVSSMLNEKTVPVTSRILKPASRAFPTMATASGTSQATVSKMSVCNTAKPALANEEAAHAASECTRCAILRSPCGPCQIPYMPAIFASKTWAVQMLDVAFSRRICCSRVCSASRKAGLPAVSVLTPTRRPGNARACSSRVAINAACGPPKPMGTPKR